MLWTIVIRSIVLFVEFCVVTVSSAWRNVILCGALQTAFQDNVSSEYSCVVCYINSIHSNILHMTPYYTAPYISGECERFVTSLKTNRCLLELDLSENLIGTAEVSV